MSAEKTLELLKKLKEDPKAKELLDGLKNTAPADDVITCYAQIAAKLGAEPDGAGRIIGALSFGSHLV